MNECVLAQRTGDADGCDLWVRVTHRMTKRKAVGLPGWSGWNNKTKTKTKHFLTKKGGKGKLLLLLING